MIVYIDKKPLKATIQPGHPVVNVPLHSSAGFGRALLSPGAPTAGRPKRKRSTVQKIHRKVQGALRRERYRMGVELHDNVSQLLASCKLYLEAMHLPQDDDRQMRDKALQLLLRSIEDIRQLSRKAVLVLPSGQTFMESIRSLADTVSGSGVFTVEVKEEGCPLDQLSQTIQTGLYRIVQEQLNNAAKYSLASTVVIRLSREMGQVHLSVSDDGIGFDPQLQERGVGLRSICARARSMKGSAIIRSEPGKGCSLLVSVPCRV